MCEIKKADYKKYSIVCILGKWFIKLKKFHYKKKKKQKLKCQVKGGFPRDVPTKFLSTQKYTNKEMLIKQVCICG